MGQLFKKMTVLFLSGVFMLSYSFPASAQAVTLDDLLKRVEAVEKQNADLQSQNAVLKADIQTLQQAQAAAPAVEANPLAPAPAAGEIPVTSKLKLSVYGFVQVENVYATAGAPSSGTTSFGNVIEYAAPHITNSKPQKTDTISAQNSRLGINISGPDVLNGKTSGQVEVDFNNPIASSSAETYQPRLRHAWAAIDYEKWGVKAGQTWDFFAPLKPDTITQSDLWRAGTIGYRHPQAYLTNKWGEVLGGKVTTQIGVIESTDIYQQNSGGPAAGMYSSYATQIAGKDVTIGGGGIFGTSATSALNNQGKNNNDMYAGVTGAQVKLTDWVSFKGQGYVGGNLANFNAGPYGDLYPGITDQTTPQYSKPLKSMGGFAEFMIKPTEKLMINTGVGIDDTINRDSVIAGTNDGYAAPSGTGPGTAGTNDLAAMWSTNRTYFTNIKYKLTPDLTVGVEYVYLLTHYLDGVISSDNRFETCMTYNF